MKSKTAGGRLRGKTALITGASRGIGLAIAHTLASEGCNLVISGRNRSALNKAERELSQRKIRVLQVVCDVRDPLQVGHLLAAVKRQFRRLDILINNAGVAHPNLSVAKLPVDAWLEVIETNLTGMFLVTRAALPLMKRGGVIVNNLSIAANRVFSGSSAYNASKHGALGFTNTLREELRTQGIRVIALLPGATDTAIWKTLWPEAPRKKMMSPKTVAEAVVSAILVPDEGTVEELAILPSAGAL
ncbi:MAG TPA: SDR family NAD(P)-dependent oxidoreductase [Terriglobales bacterium]|nr:SDR family NAD(P)-dependent oxidoreductase [Terriglobales bacterium]